MVFAVTRHVELTIVSMLLVLNFAFVPAAANNGTTQAIMSRAGGTRNTSRRLPGNLRVENG